MYLLIHEDFAVEVADEFDPEWQDSVSAGILSVFIFEDGKFLDLEADGEFVEIKNA